MRTYAQIKNNMVINTIIVDKNTPMDLFSEGYDYFIRIDTLPVIPGIRWGYDGTNFSAPPPDPIDNEDDN